MCVYSVYCVRDGAGDDSYSDSFAEMSLSSDSSDSDYTIGPVAVDKETGITADAVNAGSGASTHSNDASLASDDQAGRVDNEYSEDNENGDDEQYSDDSFQLDTDTDTESESNAAGGVQTAAVAEPVRVLLVVDK